MTLTLSVPAAPLFAALRPFAAGPFRALSPAIPLAERASIVLAWFTSGRLAYLVMGVIAIGTSTSILTTRYPLWWQLHFSKLGTYDDFSGHMFNSTMILAGLLITAFAVRVRSDLHSLAVLRNRRPSRVLIVLVASVGIHLSFVGMIPVNQNPFWHDRAASGLMLSFLGILINTLRSRKHVPLRLQYTTLGVITGLSTAIAGFITATINLAGLEFIGFTLIFTWIGVFTHCIGRGRALLTAAGAADSIIEQPTDIVRAAPATTGASRTHRRGKRPAQIRPGRVPATLVSRRTARVVTDRPPSDPRDQRRRMLARRSSRSRVIARNSRTRLA